MNELDVLESLKALPKVLSIGCETTMGNFFSQEFNIIEKALKRLKELEKAFVALSKDDEKTKKLLSKEIEKNRALEIIKKKYVQIAFIFNSKNVDEYNIRLKSIVFKKDYKIRQLTKEEYELLKEALS